MSQLTVQHIEKAIEDAMNGVSQMDAEILNIRGFSTATQRRLMNNLMNTGNPLTYLEVGLYCGATFCASLMPNVTAIGVENYSQDFGVNTVEEELEKNVTKYGDKAKNFNIIYDDCFLVDPISIPDNIDILYWDGEHTLENQAKALPYFFDKMAETFVSITDDVNWAQVAQGIDMGLIELKDKMTIERCWMLRGYHLQDDPVWHNGVQILLCKKIVK